MTNPTFNSPAYGAGAQSSRQQSRRWSAQFPLVTSPIRDSPSACPPGLPPPKAWQARSAPVLTLTNTASPARPTFSPPLSKPPSTRKHLRSRRNVLECQVHHRVVPFGAMILLDWKRVRSVGLDGSRSSWHFQVIRRTPPSSRHSTTERREWSYVRQTITVGL
jgi:hypothetical protein